MPSHALLDELHARPVALARLADLWTPAPRSTPERWGRENRRYPASAARPGQRDPGLTPYARRFAEFFADAAYETAVLVCGTQMGKTETLVDAIGWRLDTRPRPQIYVGPSKDFVVEQFEPRLMAMLNGAPRLSGLVGRGKLNKRVRKIVNGSSVRLAWAGSETSLSSDQGGDIYIDEYDKMVGRTRGTGDVYGLAKARADSYRDRKIAVTSTPKRGRVLVERDERSGLEFWTMADPKDLESPVWARWQSGTRHHWAWKCPHCSEWFIPRLRNLDSPPGSTPAQARRSTWLVCPRHGCIITEDHKAAMNAAGVWVAPGQAVDDCGVVDGAPPDSSTLSLWVSGLASPFVTWGERKEEEMTAEALADDEARQGAANKCAELWARDTGAAPEWQELAALRLPYRMGDLPEGPRVLTAGVDVQGNRLVVVIGGWAARSEFWLLQAVELFGDTREDGVWHDLIDFLRTPIGSLTVRMCFVDSGFRPGKPGTTPEHKVYAVCRSYPSLLRPAKGYATRSTPLSMNNIEVTPSGGRAAYGLQLARLDTDYFKGFVHERLKWPVDTLGAFHIAEDAADDYLKQLVSEARVTNVAGAPVWLMRSKDNHFLDATALCFASGYFLGAQRIRADATMPSRVAPGHHPAPVAAGSAVAAAAAGQGVAPPQEQKPERVTMADLNKKR